MNIRRAGFVLSGWLLLASGLTGQPLAAAPATEVLARVHWLGLNRISADTNSAHFLSVWRLPQTAALVTQTLDKFSRWLAGGMTNAASARLRPLLDDLVTSECYWELRAPTNFDAGTSNLQAFLAIRLPDDRVRSWQTNLAAAVENLTGAHPVSTWNGWRLRPARAPEQIEFSRAGQWMLVSWGPETDDSLSKFVARILREPAVAADFWLEADLNPARLVPRLTTFGSGTMWWGEAADEPSSVTQSGAITTREDARPTGSGKVYYYPTLNHFHTSVMGRNGNVLTRGTLDFSRPLDLSLSPWEIPTNLIQGPLISFTAVRGSAPWLAVTPAWQKLGLTPPPNQAYFWAQDGIPFQTYFAAPLPAASNQLWRLAGRLVQNANPWLATNAQGNFKWNNNPPRLVWNDALIISPYLIPVTISQQDYVLGGLYPLAADNSNPLPPEILRAVRDTPDLVYYDAELTGTRADQCLFISQLFRIVFHKPQLPATATATVWLKKVEPLLAASSTKVTQTGAAQLALTQSSTIGLTALELHLLADWLESPQFPRGLHTFLAPPDK